MYPLSAKLAQNYQVTALVVGLSVWKLSCSMLPFVYSEFCKVGLHYPIHLFTFIIVGVLHKALTGG